MAKKTGGSAFPQANHDAYGMGPGTIDDTGIFDTQGMTLRDWFAGQALVGAIASLGGRSSPGDAALDFAKSAYLIADAMLAERAK